MNGCLDCRDYLQKLRSCTSVQVTPSMEIYYSTKPVADCPYFRVRETFAEPHRGGLLSFVFRNRREVQDYR